MIEKSYEYSFSFNRKSFSTWLHILADWTWIVFSIYLSVNFQGWLVYLFSFVIIGSRQHAIAVHLHDATHYLLFRSRSLNDGVARLLMEWPLFASLDNYRRLHRGHHYYLNTCKDPDWVRNSPYKMLEATSFPRRVWLLSGAGVFLQAVSALFFGVSIDRKEGVARTMHQQKPWVFWLRCLFYTVTLALLYVNNWLPLFFFYWVMPYLFYFFPVMRFRGLSEHWALPSTRMENKSRTVKVGWLGRFLIYPKNINYHVEHHTHPNVPFYYLPELHRCLINNKEYRHHAHITNGVWGVVKELLGFRYSF